MWIKVLLPPPAPLLLPVPFLTIFFFQAKELDANTEYYIELLAKGTGKPKEELVKDIQRPKYLKAQEAIDYGIADKLLSSNDDAFEKRVIFSLHLAFLLCLILCAFSDNMPSMSRIMMHCLLKQKP